MAGHSLLAGEVSNSKVAAVFANEAAAREVAAHVQSALQLSAAQVQVITPADRRPGRKLEPESEGIFRTIIRAHVRLGLLGAPTRIAQAAGPLAFGVLLDRFGAGVLVVTTVMSLSALLAFSLVRIGDGRETRSPTA